MNDRLKDYLARRRDYRRNRDRAMLGQMPGPSGTSHTNSYDSTSSYGTSDHKRGRRRRGRRRDMSYDNRGYSSRDNSYGVGHYIYEQPFTPYMDRKSHEDMKEYEEDLKEWILDLKEDDRFKLPEHEVFKKASEMGIQFHEYTELEFYAIYLMMISDYPDVVQSPHTGIAMAKAFLHDDDIEISPSEKVCKYLYEIVMAE